MEKAIHLLLCGFLFIAASIMKEKEKTMPYSREYNEEKYTEITPYLKELEQLEEEKVLSLHFVSVEEAERVRWLFYDYFSITATRRVFKLTLFNNLLIIGKTKPSLSNLTSAQKERGVTKELDSLIQEFLAAPDPREVLALLARDKSISFTALGIVLGEVGRVLGE